MKQVTLQLKIWTHTDMTTYAFSVSQLMDHSDCVTLQDEFAERETFPTFLGVVLHGVLENEVEEFVVPDENSLDARVVVMLKPNHDTRLLLEQVEDGVQRLVDGLHRH